MKQLFTLCLTCACIPFTAATYYVSVGGNDMSTGLSAEQSFETIQHASDIVMQGDSVIVLPGNYTGFYHTTSGTANERIVFMASAGVFIDTPNQTTDDGINLEGSDYVNVEGFTVTAMPRAGIRSVTNTGVIIRNNICTQNEMWGILTGFSEDILIEYNTCSFSVVEHGIYFGNSADNPVIRFNICHDNHANGIHMNADASLGGDGIISNALVVGNTCYNNGVAGGSAINCDGVQQSVIENNLIYNNHASGISLYMIDAAEPCDGTHVVNNTILQPADARWALNITNGSEGVVVFNNIMLSDHAFRGSITADAQALASLVSNYNIMSDRMSVDDGESNVSLSEWQQQTGQDENSFTGNVDELFVNAAASDYELSAGSDALDAGTAWMGKISAPTVDIVNTARPQGPAFDIGCFEKESTATTEELKPLDIVRTIRWTDIPADAYTEVYDGMGKMIFSGSKPDFKNGLLHHGGSMLYFTTRLRDGRSYSGKFMVSRR